MAVVGFVTTAVGIVLACIPAADEANKILAFCKILGGTGVLMGAGWLLYVLGSRAAKSPG